VLEWPAADVADQLDTTTTAVDSAQRRARAQLARVLPTEDELAEPTAPGRRALLDAYAAAVENADAGTLSDLLRADIVLEMPPIAGWFVGRDPVMEVIAAKLFAPPGQLRLVPVVANGQPGFAVYRRESDSGWHAHAVQVLTPGRTGVARITVFVDPNLFGLLGLPGVAGPDRPTPAAVPWAR
jgi:RNA polymerase sigma-70 factor (ECF subfamily)